MVGDSTASVRSVRFRDGNRVIATVKRGSAGLYSATWRAKGSGRHALSVELVDADGAVAKATRTVKVCAKA